MKKIISTSLLVTACLCGTLTSCDIERLPKGSMSAEQITNDPWLPWTVWWMVLMPS